MATKKARDLEGQLPMHGVGEADVPNLEPLALSSHGLSGRETLSGAEVDVGAGSTGKEQRQEFFLPVSGFVWLYPEEVRVVDHPTFQRLGRINQLGQTYVVYRGATHKRIEHSLGAVHVAQRMIEAVEHNGRKNQLDGETRRRKLRDSEWRFIRLGALLHDIGHLAAGHTIEDELSLLGKHDADRRLDKIFESDSWLDEQGRTLAKVIDGEYAKYVPASLRDKVSASVLVRLLIRKTPAEGHQDDHGNEETLAAAAADFAHQVCKDMIGNTICADILDYLYRDWYHIGKPRPFDDRLLQYMEVRTVPNKSDCFVISTGKRPKIRTDAISAILELLESRYQLAESVLYHRTKTAAAAMLDRALFELWSDAEEDLEDLLLPLSDEELLAFGIEKSKARNDERGGVSASLLQRLQNRQVFTALSTRFYENLPPDVVAAIEKTYGAEAVDKKQAAGNRNRVLRVLESDFGLPVGALAMYCPGNMNAKIARVKIAVGDAIDEFAKYEEKHNDQLAGGHLDAQLKRFRRLWRVQFFIDPKVKEGLGERLHVLQSAIDKLALGHIVDDDSKMHAVRSFAQILTQTEGSRWSGKKVRDRSLMAAYQDSSTATGSYPLGANSIRSFIEE
jgi:HD superfamily phosphohydrolase